MNLEIFYEGRPHIVFLSEKKKQKQQYDNFQFLSPEFTFPIIPCIQLL